MNLPLLSFGSGLLLLPFLLVAPIETPDSTPKPPRYVGASKCKSCHKGAAKGEAYEKWTKGPHAKAFEVLASKEAKEIGAKMGVADPQKSDKCLKCHVTAHGVEKKMIRRGFKHTEGIGCESCHGPGENHNKIRMKEAQKEGGAPAPVAAEEINSTPDIATCTKCHNEDSPTYKPFCFKERMAKIRHLDPRKKRSDEEVKAVEEKCTDDCKVCAKKKKTDNEDG